MKVLPIRFDAEVAALLHGAGLPIEDLRDGSNVRLFGMRDEHGLIGVVGVEACGEAGLLRSLVVAGASRSGGHGRALVDHVETWASGQGVRTLYLLTTTAADFFSRLGYAAASRSEAPPAIAATAQFSVLCPASSTFMSKALDARRQVEMTSRSGMELVGCTFERHAGSILDILNEAIANTTALYDYRPRSRDSMTTWFAIKAAGGFPVMGFESDTGELLGFATYGTFRAWPAYKYTVEHSVYVHHAHRGRGIGRKLLETLIARAREAGVHVLVGGIDASNAGSIALHERLGFVHAGTIREAGFKFGRWLDLAFYQRILDAPRNPVDG